MPRKQSEVEKSLSSKGFRHKEGDHNYFNYYSTIGKKTAVFTKTSHGAREIDDHLLGRMAKQCKLSRADFDRLIVNDQLTTGHCSVSRSTRHGNNF